MPYQYAYLTGILFLITIWIFIFLKRKDLRNQILIVSLLATPIAPISQLLWFYYDYWRPSYLFTFYINDIPLGLEESIFAFTIGGITCVLFEVLFRKKAKRGKKRNILTLIIIIITILIGAITKYIFHLNSIWSTTIPMLLVSSMMVLYDRDLIFDYLISGLTIGVITIFIYLILLNIYPLLFSELWVNGVLTDPKILNIPIQELSWFVTLGFYSGILYDFWSNTNKYENIK